MAQVYDPTHSGSTRVATASRLVARGNRSRHVASSLRRCTCADSARRRQRDQPFVLAELVRLGQQQTSINNSNSRNRITNRTSSTRTAARRITSSSSNAAKRKWIRRRQIRRRCKTIELPGLGGTPLAANGNVTATGHDAGNKSNDAILRTLRHERCRAAATSSATHRIRRLPHVASRDLSPPATRRLRTHSSAVTRSSPGRRTAPHITPDELRRELSGTFPTPTDEE